MTTTSGTFSAMAAATLPGEPGRGEQQLGGADLGQRDDRGGRGAAEAQRDAAGADVDDRCAGGIRRCG